MSVSTRPGPKGAERASRPRFRSAWPVLFALLCLFAPNVAAAEDSPSAEGVVCPLENLLRTARVIAGVSQARAALLFDETIAPEGAPWPGETELVTVHGPLAFDLGALTPLKQVFFQADADQSIDLRFSSDGSAWTHVPIPAHRTASGMLSRAVQFGPIVARYVQISATDASATTALTELHLYCQARQKVRKSLRVVGPGGPSPSPSLRGLLPALSPTAIDRIKLAILLVVFVTILGGAWRKRGETRALRAPSVLLAALALFAYFNFGAYRYPAYLHHHDVFHYFVGAKYFPELGYTELYSCSAIAEAEAGFPQRVSLRSQRDLTTNQLVSGAQILAHASSCKGRFSSERWRTFADDVRYFAGARTVPDWHRILKDHGFNASPTWIAAGRAVVRRLPATEATVGSGTSLFSGVVGPLDPFLLAIALLFVVWAFGLRTAALVAVVFGCNGLSEFAWVGGGFLRELWLSTLVVGLCLLRRCHSIAGGIALAFSSLFQLFPAVCFASLFFGAALGGWKTKIDRTVLRAVGAGALAVVVLVPLSASIVGRRDAWAAFAENTAKHARTPSGNLVGLKTALSFRMDMRASVLFDDSADDPFARVRAARHANYARLRPFGWIGMGLGVFLLGRAVRGSALPWWTATLGLALVALFLETSCYYSTWLAALLLAGEERRTLELPVLGVVLGALVTKILVPEMDVASAIVSVVLSAGVLVFLALAGRKTPAG